MKSDAAETLTRLLNGRNVKTRQAAGNWMAICPAHEDGRPSLAIRVGSNGKLMYRCHAGCSFGNIRKAIELLGYDAFNGQPLSSSKKFVAEPVQPPPPEHTYAPYEDPAWIERPQAFATLAGRPTERRHVYRDLEGKPLMTVTMVRLETGGEGRKEKLFLATTPRKAAFDIFADQKSAEKQGDIRRAPLVAKGQVFLEQKANPTPRLPYGAERSGRPGPVFIIEGEKKADVLDTILEGSCTVISAFGANPEGLNLDPYKGRAGIMMTDHDAPGLIQSFRYGVIWPGPFAAIKTPFAQGKSFDIVDLASKANGTVTMKLIATTIRRHAKIEFAKTNYLKRGIAMMEAGRRVEFATTCQKTAEQMIVNLPDACRIHLLEAPKGSEPWTEEPLTNVPLLSRRSKDEMKVCFTWFDREAAGAIIDLHGIETTDPILSTKSGLSQFLTSIVVKRTEQFRTLIAASDHLLNIVSNRRDAKRPDETQIQDSQSMT